MRAVAIIACWVVVLCGGAWAYPENYASSKLGASVITQTELDGKRDPNAILSDAPVPKGRIAFARVRQKQVLTIDLGDERIFDRIDLGTDEPGAVRSARWVRIEVARESLLGPYQPIFEKAGLDYFQVLRIPKVKARWVRIDLGEGDEGALVHSLRIYKSYEHPRLTEVTRLLSEQVKPGIPGLEEFYKSVDARDWTRACAVLRAHCAEKHPAQAKLDAEMDLSRAQRLASGDLDTAGIERQETVPIDWSGLRSSDWVRSRAALSRGAWIATAADACFSSGDVKWARFLKSILYDWIDANPRPASFDGLRMSGGDGLKMMGGAVSVDDYPTWRTSDAAARARVLVSRFSEVTADRDIDDELWANWLYSIWEHVDYLSKDTLSTGESMTSAAAVVVTAAGEFKFFSGEQDWITYAQQSLARNVPRDVAADGKIIDDSPAWVASAYSALAEALAGIEKAGNKVAPDVRERIGRMERFLAAIALPDGSMPAIGDEMPGAYAGQAAVGDGEAKGSANFPLGGWCVMRGGEDQNARQLILKASRGPHSHDDLLALTVYANGRGLLIDPEGTRKTAFHNTLCVDGLDQPDMPGKIDRWFSNAGVDWAVASHHAHKDLTVVRNIVFVKPDYWVLRDELESEVGGAHVCDQNWHFPKDTSLVEDPSTGTVHTGYPSGGNMQIVPAGADGLSSTAASGAPGAASWTYRKAGELPVLVDLALCPYVGTQPPAVSIKRLAVEGSPVGVMAIKVEAADGVDYVIASRKGPQAVSVPGERIRVDAEVVVIRMKAGRVVRVSGGAVKSISVRGTVIFSQEEPAVEVDLTP